MENTKKKNAQQDVKKCQLKKKKVLKLTFIGLGFLSLFLLLLTGYSSYHVAQVERDRSAKVVRKEPSVVMFYRDNCPDCHKVFSQVLAAKDAGIPIQFFNTMSTDRKKVLNYLKEYEVEEVPTFILLDQDGDEITRYSGTDMNKINALLHKAGGLN